MHFLGKLVTQLLLLQSSLRAFLGVAAPAVEHRAGDDVGVLLQITKRLLKAANADSLHDFMVSSMQQAARGLDVPYAGLISDVLQPKSESRTLNPAARHKHLPLERLLAHCKQSIPTEVCIRCKLDASDHLSSGCCVRQLRADASL